jgi:hypothetical protein
MLSGWVGHAKANCELTGMHRMNRMSEDVITRNRIGFLGFILNIPSIPVKMIFAVFCGTIERR